MSVENQAADQESVANNAVESDQNTIARDQESSASEPDTSSEGEGQSETGKDLSEADLRKALAAARKEAADRRVELRGYKKDAEAYRQAREAEKSELQREREAREALEAQLRTMEIEQARAKTLRDKGLGDEVADLLGDDPEQFEARAEKLLAIKQEAAAKSAPPSDYPVSSLKAGTGAAAKTGEPPYPSDWKITGPYAKS